MLDGASSRLEKQQSKKVLKELKSVLKVKEKEFQVSCFYHYRGKKTYKFGPCVADSRYTVK